MLLEPAVLIAAAGIVIVALLARREASAAAAERRDILSPALAAVDSPRAGIDPTGYPTIDGQIYGDDVRVRLIPDTMTIRRLPQLWVEVTILNDLALSQKGLSILIRPSGADYFSLTDSMPVRLDPPPDFPTECLVRGQSPASAETLASVAATAAKIFRDPRVKELAMTSRGTRIVRQLAEGRRGEHLLLRQSKFDGARLAADDLTSLFAKLRDIDRALRPMKRSAA